MRFTIIDGLPYMVSNGRLYPVDIKDGKVTYSREQSSMTDSMGEYTLAEVMAKCTKLCSIKRKRQTAE
jgi:hypothetical protein|nr:MAG TPA: hypothetical protein [Caudoviricetes sp.]